ncbi:MAG: Lsm family RNA-binding protein [Pyrodictiaceae archaeon]
MSFVPAGTRKIISELNNLVGRRVAVFLTNGKKYEGILLGFDHPELNVLLADVEIEEGRRIPRLLVKGSVVAEIHALETSIFDAKEFAEYLKRKLGLRDDAIRVYEDAGVVVVFNSIRVTAEGVEGSGPYVPKINYVLKEYLEAKSKGEQLK